MVVQHVFNNLVHIQHDFETYIFLVTQSGSHVAYLDLLVISLWCADLFFISFHPGQQQENSLL